METGSINPNMNAVSLSNALDKTSMGKEDFLKLLIAQMKNQDPLSPMENQEYASQLAQFSSLEQLQSVNSNLEQGVEINLILTQAINNTMASTLVGKEVTALGNTIQLTQDGDDLVPSEIGFKLGEFSDSVTIEIRDSAGTLVRTIEQSDQNSGDHSLTWDGLNDDGFACDAGDYTFTVRARDDQGASVSATTYLTGMIESVKFENGMAMLIVNGQEVPFSQVLEVS